MSEKSLSEINFSRLTRRKYHPSPAAWEDQVLYFLMLDRFSDGREQGYRDNDGTPCHGGSHAALPARPMPATPSRPRRRRRWREAGGSWAGRHPERAGKQDRLPEAPGGHRHLDQPGLQAGALPGDLPRLRHPEFPGGRSRISARRQDLRDLVQTAHRHGIYVILDIILNHTGNVFGYAADRYWTQDPAAAAGTSIPLGRRPYPVAGFHDASGQPTSALRPGRPGSAPAAPGRTGRSGRPSSRTGHLHRARAASATGITTRNSWKATSTI